MHHIGVILLLVLAFLLLGPLAVSALSLAAQAWAPMQASLLALSPAAFSAPAGLVAILLLGAGVVATMKLAFGA